MIGIREFPGVSIVSNFKKGTRCVPYGFYKS